MTVFLLGYRGCGKTTVARLLAERLGWECVDADQEIVRRAGRTIADIFAAGGEDAFRDLESAVVGDLALRERAVVALGGGAILREQNRRALAGRGRMIWLTASAPTILARVSGDAATAAQRPALTTAGGLAEIEHMLARRTPLYRQCADHILDTEDKTPAQVAAEILALIET
jgi:shikimate kinase